MGVARRHEFYVSLWVIKLRRKYEYEELLKIMEWLQRQGIGVEVVRLGTGNYTIAVEGNQWNYAIDLLGNEGIECQP